MVGVVAITFTTHLRSDSQASIQDLPTTSQALIAISVTAKTTAPSTSTAEPFVVLADSEYWSQLSGGGYS